MTYSSNYPGQTRYIASLNDKKNEPVQKNNISTYISNRNVAYQNNKKPEQNKEKDNNMPGNMPGNKSYKTFTYTSSQQAPLNSGSIVITSSRVKEDKDEPLTKGRIHHMISVRTPKSRSNSKSSKNNSNYKNNSITIISSRGNIETDKNKNNGEIIPTDNNKRGYVRSNNKNTNSSRTYITNFNIRNTKTE